jgi:hypothetical protein
VHANATVRSEAESGGGVAALLFGLGALTMVFFPLAIPALVLTIVLTIPLLPLVIVPVLAGAVVAVPWLGARALGRRLRARASARAPATANPVRP